jgi:hypothetical protein
MNALFALNDTGSYFVPFGRKRNLPKSFKNCCFPAAPALQCAHTPRCTWYVESNIQNRLTEIRLYFQFTCCFTVVTRSL